MSDVQSRLDAAKRALVGTGYFTAEEVGDDLAPRITELAAWRAAEDEMLGEEERAHRAFFLGHLTAALHGAEADVLDASPVEGWVRVATAATAQHGEAYRITVTLEDL
jgi:hypothetical protein